jgi:hypothetical protein
MQFRQRKRRASENRRSFRAVAKHREEVGTQAASVSCFGNAVHSYTDVDANMPGKAQYNPLVTARAYAMMDTFFAEAFTAH